MRSETRRIAKALVDSSVETFATHYPREQSAARLAEAIAKNKPRTATVKTTWRHATEGLRLDVHLRPARGVRVFLAATSLALTMMLVACAWVLMSHEEPTPLRFLVPLVTALGVLGFPLLILALGSQREAEEARLRRAIRHALLDEEEFPRPLRDRE